MNKQRGQIKSGTGSLFQTLKKGHSVFLEQLQGAKTNEEAFQLMIEAIRKVEDPAKKAYLVYGVI
jgi:hypothetical protein